MGISASKITHIVVEKPHVLLLQILCFWSFYICLRLNFNLAIYFSPIVIDYWRIYKASLLKISHCFTFWTQNLRCSLRSSVIRQRIARGWNDNCSFAFDAVSKICPLVDVSSPRTTRPWVRFYGAAKQNIIPQIDVGQSSDKGLCWFKTCCNSILFLSQHQRSSCLYDVASLKVYAVVMQDPVFVELPRPVTVSPSHTYMMPSAIVGRNSWSPITEKYYENEN